MDALIEKQLRDAGIFSGAIMNDHEYRTFLSRCGATGDAEMTGGFTVLVGATQDFVAGVKAQNRVARRITVFPSPASRQMLTFALQFGTSQCRVLFDLEAPSTRRMLESIALSGVLRFVFATTEQPKGQISDGVEISLDIGSTAAADILKLPIGACTAKNDHDYVVDMALMACRLYQDRGLLLIKGQPTPEIVTLTDFMVRHSSKEVEIGRTVH